MRLLIAENSQLFADFLSQQLEDSMEIRVCRDGCDTLALLPEFLPDALILNLALPRMDGLTVLRQTRFAPPVILGFTGYLSGDIQQTAYALGVSKLTLMPSVSGTAASLLSLLEQARDPNAPKDPRQLARSHLRALNFPTHLAGYRLLCVALPIFAADPSQTLSKELYPAVAKIMGHSDSRAVERAIRTAIAKAWQTRDVQSWNAYFPGDRVCPNNKRFLSRLAEMMEE